MKIFYDSQIFNAQIYGGISRYFVRLIENLESNKKNKIQIGGPTFLNQYLSEVYLDKTKKGTKVGKLLKAPSKILSHLSNHLNCLFSNYDIIHKTYYYPEIYRSKNAVNILTVYDLIHELFPNDDKNIDKFLKQKKRAISRADHIICISKNTKNDLMEIYGVEENKVSVVYLGFDNFSLKIKNLKNLPALNGPRPKYLLYVGSRIGHKNFTNFIRAFSHIKGQKNPYHVLCFGGGDFSKNEIQLFESLKIVDKVKYTSGDDTALAICYLNADIFVYPSLYEGFGIPPLEAMSAGCPVLASNSSSIPEVCGPAALYFDPNNIKSILNAIETLLNDSEKRSDLTKLGFEQVTKFSWKKCAEETLAIYKSVKNYVDE